MFWFTKRRRSSEASTKSAKDGEHQSPVSHDYDKFDQECSLMTTEELLIQHKRYTVLSEEPVPSVSASSLSIPLSLGVPGISTAVSSPVHHIAEQKKLIIEKHLKFYGVGANQAADYDYAMLRAQQREANLHKMQRARGRERRSKHDEEEDELEEEDEERESHHPSHKQQVVRHNTWMNAHINREGYRERESNTSLASVTSVRSNRSTRSNRSAKSNRSNRSAKSSTHSARSSQCSSRSPSPAVHPTTLEATSATTMAKSFQNLKLSNDSLAGMNVRRGSLSPEGLDDAAGAGDSDYSDYYDSDDDLDPSQPYPHSSASHAESMGQYGMCMQQKPEEGGAWSVPPPQHQQMGPGFFPNNGTRGLSGRGRGMDREADKEENQVNDEHGTSHSSSSSRSQRRRDRSQFPDDGLHYVTLTRESHMFPHPAINKNQGEHHEGPRRNVHFAA